MQTAVKLEMKRAKIRFLPRITSRLLCAALLLAPGMAAGSREPGASAIEPTKPGEVTQPRISADRTGFLQTSD
jgi:hypothetical protein